MASMVSEGPANELEQMFYKEPGQIFYLSDKIVKDQLRDLIDDLKTMPEDSLFKTSNVKISLLMWTKIKVEKVSLIKPP